MRCGNCKGTHPTSERVRNCYGASGKLPGSSLPAPTDTLVEDDPFAGLEVVTPEDIRALRQPPLPKVQPVREAPEGVHLLDGSYYKVQVAVHGSGRKYAKLYDTTTDKWVYARGVVRRLSPDTVVSAEEAARFGKLYGRCCFCGRTLTDERSIDVGYGPVCADNAGLPWG